ncbi:NAD(P)-binding domain-containing protein [Piscinibacter sp. XHJ-5]|uniref:NAD(P)-binding domain-containing protein n=1 Tax=Piscinibacter sp. XHJ-5 TaxID=3037797 RepID=UPI002452BABC|nr:NAD(P)-binding domain-containing protein [Piscinibacter sp. XHJ-5]
MTPARAIDVVVVGAGHNGLAMSAALSAHGVDHVVLERGAVADRWLTQRWDSMRLLTPNWMTRLPGWHYAGADPDGFMTAAQMADFIAGYAAHLAAPVRAHTPVHAAWPHGDGYRVQTDDGTWQCRALVIASGAFGEPVLPRVAAQMPPGLHGVSAARYRRPEELPHGGVLVVGASATGLQLAREIHASGRPVTLAVGEHVRLPRLYRGRDIHWWMHVTGLLEQRIEDEAEPDRARRLPSPQLMGTPQRSTLDLNTLRAQGVEVVGRLVGVRDGKAQFSGSLRNVCALADLKMNRLLDGIDARARSRGLDPIVGPVERFAPTLPSRAPRLALDLGGDVRSVVWATGYRPELSWLHAPVFDERGGLRHDRGVVAASRLFVLGLPFMRRRQSSFILGCEDDVRALSLRLVAQLRAMKPATVRDPKSVRLVEGRDALANPPERTWVQSA